MTIVHITRGFGDYFVELINGLPRSLDIHVVLAEGDEWIANALNANVKVFLSKAPSVKRLGNIGAMWRTVRYIRSVRPAVVHVQAGVFWELIFLLFFPRLVKVVTIHDVTKHLTKDSRHSFPQDFVDVAARFSDCLIVHGKVIKREAAARFGEAMRTHVIPHGIISRYGSAPGSYTPRDGGRVLLFGTVDEYKGVEYLIEAERYLRSDFPNIQVRVAGHCKEKEYYTSLVALDQRISLDLTRQSDEQVRFLFLWADVVVLPYVEASQSGVLQLAFAFGVPAVVTNVGALGEVVTHGINGMVIPPRDAVALASAVGRLLRDMDLRRVVIDGIGRSRESDYSWHSIGIKTAELYRELVSGKTA